MIEARQIGYTEISIFRSPHTSVSLIIIYSPQFVWTDWSPTTSVRCGSHSRRRWMDRSLDRRTWSLPIDLLSDEMIEVICLTIDLLFSNVNLFIHQCILYVLFGIPRDPHCLPISNSRPANSLTNSPLANIFFMLFRCVVQFQRLCRNWNWHSSRPRLIPFMITSNRPVSLRQMSCRLSSGDCCLLRLHTRTGSRITFVPSTL